MRRSGADVRGIPMEPDGVDVDAFEKMLKFKVPKLFYTVPDFQNPSGITTCGEKRKRIAELAETYGFFIVEDGPYRPLRYYGEDEPSYRELVPNRVVFISSFSKTLSPGIRVGFMIGPEELMPGYHTWSEDTYIHPNLVAEGMVYEYCRRGLLGPNIEKLKTLYRPRLDGILTALDKYMDKEVTWIRPQGGFFVSITLSDNIDGKRLQENSKQFGFVVANGNGFFVDGKGERFIRLPFCQMEPAEAEEGVKRLSEAITQYRGN
jgi:DNA-binding transcriptional MocR family regulator